MEEGQKKADLQSVGGEVTPGAAGFAIDEPFEAQSSRIDSAATSPTRNPVWMVDDSLLERVTAAVEARHLSQNTLTAYRRTCVKAHLLGVRRGPGL